MIVSSTPGIIKKFKRAPGGFQTTFATPLKDLDKFVPAILSANAPFEESSLTIGQIVFEPKNLIALLSAHALPTKLQDDWSFMAKGEEQIHELLRAALSDWVDFLFVPMPKPFVIYADHDEYTTFYANTESDLNRVADVLLAKGFKQVLGYQREF
jgi:hypothetical protein